MFIGMVRVQLKVPYNSFYNVNVAAMPPCQRNNVTTFIGPRLYYSKYQLLQCHVSVAAIAVGTKDSWFVFVVSAKCSNPAKEYIRIMGYSDPAIHGSNITFGCLSEFVPYTSTCMGNGEWAPDPEDFELNCSGQCCRQRGVIITSVKIYPCGHIKH